MVILDHLGRLTGPAIRNNRYAEVGEIAKALKLTAQQPAVPVIALCQLNRAVEDRNSRRPRLSDLRDSGRIEEEADNVLFIWSDEEGRAKEEEIATVMMALEKHRAGPTGTCAPFHPPALPVRGRPEREPRCMTMSAPLGRYLPTLNDVANHPKVAAALPLVRGHRRMAPRGISGSEECREPASRDEAAGAEPRVRDGSLEERGA